MTVSDEATTALAAGISTEEQESLILLEMLRQERLGYWTRSMELWQAIEARMGAQPLSDGGRATIRYLVNTPLKKRGWVRLRPHQKQGWLLTDEGRTQALRIESERTAAEHPPTVDAEDLERHVRELIKKGQVQKPIGSSNPVFVSTRGQRRPQRDPRVKAWVLQQAAGQCQLCGASAPFLTADGTPFLEVHHVERLADGGADTVENTAAVCPNCHRALHYSAKSETLAGKLRESLPLAR